MRMLDLAEAALATGVSPRSLVDPRYRARIGLRACKVGRRVVFEEAEIRQFLERSRERGPKDTPPNSDATPSPVLDVADAGR